MNQIAFVLYCKFYCIYVLFFYFWVLFIGAFLTILWLFLAFFRPKSAKNGKSGQKLEKLLNQNIFYYTRKNSNFDSLVKIWVIWTLLDHFRAIFVILKFQNFVSPHNEIVITSKKMLQIGSKFARTLSNKIGSHTLRGFRYCIMISAFSEIVIWSILGNFYTFKTQNVRYYQSPGISQKAYRS